MATPSLAKPRTEQIGKAAESHRTRTSTRSPSAFEGERAKMGETHLSTFAFFSFLHTTTRPQEIIRLIVSRFLRCSYFIFV